ncbi:MAG: N-acetylmuramoyl-L-alanine amidase, partial [Bryobacteraceae bacterium]|nr:N-acetylmuramoyl-L-alanine amidase [Bryobacteraceae bacterium]
MRTAAAIPLAIVFGVAALGMTGDLAAQQYTNSITPAVKAAPGRNVAMDARVVGDAKRTRFIVDLTRQADLHVFTLADPYRVIVDIPDVSFDLPQTAGKKGRGLISAFRYGLFGKDKARIVIDATGPVLVDKAFVLDAMDDQPARLVIDLVPTDRASYMKKAGSQQNTAPVRATETPKAAGERKVVVIDAGHGGDDTGAVAASGEEEKNVALAVTLKLRDALEKTGRYKVVLTRSDDTFIPLNERVNVARTNNASLFISIHADSIASNTSIVTGATIYTASDRASDLEAARFAAKENSADRFGKLNFSTKSPDVDKILFDLAHRETKNLSSVFARSLVTYMKEAARMHKTPLKSAGFVVLKAPDVPSVLVE